MAEPHVRLGCGRPLLSWRLVSLTLHSEGPVACPCSVLSVPWVKLSKPIKAPKTLSAEDGPWPRCAWGVRDQVDKKVMGPSSRYVL